MKLNFDYYWKKILAALKVRTFVGGLEVSDLVMRLAYFDGKIWQMAGVRLEPGIMETGRIKNRDSFVLALRTLKSQIFKGRDLKRKTNVIVSLSSINIYSQVFNLPIIKGGNLEKAIQLNIQMISPVDTSEAYAGWQMASEDKESLRLEVLSAFIDKNIVDELTKALLDGGFLAVAVESKALALARLLREESVGFNESLPCILLSIDNSGIDFLIIRRGQLYFEYFNSWRDIAGDKNEIQMPVFSAAVTRSLHQVMNFYSQHWQEPLGEIVLSATALVDETKKIVGDNFSLRVRELKLKMSQSIGAEWFVALGCGVRGTKPRSEDKEVSLLGIGAREEFRREQFVSFMNFWRLLVPSALGLILISFLLSDLFLIQARKSLEAQAVFNLSGAQTGEYSALTVQAQDFDRSVSFIETVQKSFFSKSKLWGRISGIMSANGIKPNHFSFQDPNSPVTLSGVAKSESQIAAFKDALAKDSEFSNVELPLSAIKSSLEGLSFSLTFKLSK